MMAVKVLSKGQITLPRKIRAELHIKEGDTLVLERTEDGVMIRRGKTIFDYLGALPSVGLTVKDFKKIDGLEVRKP